MSLEGDCIDYARRQLLPLPIVMLTARCTGAARRKQIMNESNKLAFQIPKQAVAKWSLVQFDTRSHRRNRISRAAAAAGPAIAMSPRSRIVEHGDVLQRRRSKRVAVRMLLAMMRICPSRDSNAS